MMSLSSGRGCESGTGITNPGQYRYGYATLQTICELINQIIVHAQQARQFLQTLCVYFICLVFPPSSNRSAFLPSRVVKLLAPVTCSTCKGS